MTPKEFKRERLRMGLSQPTLARMLGISMRALCYYESGGRPIREPVARLLRNLARQSQDLTEAFVSASTDKLGRTQA